MSKKNRCESDEPCKLCGSTKQIQKLTGITQLVYWDEDDSIIKEETDYSSADEKSEYACGNSDCKNYLNFL